MNITQNYFRPLEKIVECNLSQLKAIDLLIIATYATIIVPVGFIAFAILHECTWRQIPSEGTYTYFAQKILADRGNVTAQYQVGLFFLHDDDVRASHYFKMAADQGHHDSQYRLAEIYYNAAREDKHENIREALNLKLHDYEIAKSYFTLAAASQEIPDAYYFLAQIALHENKPEEVLNFYKQCVALSNHHGNWTYHAKIELSKDYLKKAQEFKKNNEKQNAFEHFKLASELWNNEAKRELSLCYETGYGTEPNLMKALELLKYSDEYSTNRLKEFFDKYNKGAEAGNRDDINTLGCLYEKGYGCQSSGSEALKLYTKSAELGCKEAQHNLGRIYEYTPSAFFFAKDLEKAKEWYQKAADQGYQASKIELARFENFEKLKKAAEEDCPIAQNNLGALYHKGSGCIRDYDKAFEWFTKSANQGDKDGQYNVGFCYDYGYGVEVDLVKAKEWYQKAADQGLQVSIDAIARLNEDAK